VRFYYVIFQRVDDFSDLIPRLCIFVFTFVPITRSSVLRTNYTLRLTPTASALVQRMLRYFFTTLWPTFRHIRQTTTSLSGVSGGTATRPQLALPLFVPPEFREPYVAAPRPIMPRDTSSFRVQSNPYSGSEPSSWPLASSYPVPVLPGSAPS
jgi:hypothetical protein